MDLKAYYRKVHEVESAIPTPFVVVIGLDTPDGGKAGTRSEAARPVAAKLITEVRARLATEEEAKIFYGNQADARREAEALAAAQRMQVTLVPSSEYRSRQTKGPKD